MACASTLAAMLDAPVSVFLQMAEYRESTKRESYMSLSSSLGQILVQLHTGIQDALLIFLRGFILFQCRSFAYLLVFKGYLSQN